MSKCKLCHNKTTLLKSHIIPEFCYEPLYDSKHRYFGLSTDEDDRFYIRQKGIYEYLLCKDCEGKLSKYEKYLREVLFGGEEIKILKENIYQIDYIKFKLFYLSVLWRSSISRDSQFEHVNLGKYHEEKLRQIIVSQNVGSFFEYGLILVLNVDNKDNIINGIINSPDSVKIDGGHRIYRFLFCGLWWMILVSSHSHELPRKFFSLTENGVLKIFKKNMMQNPIVVNFAKNLPSQKMEKIEKYFNSKK